MGCALGLVDLDIFLVVDCLLPAYQMLIIAHKKVSSHNLISNIFLSVLRRNGQNLS